MAPHSQGYKTLKIYIYACVIFKNNPNTYLKYTSVEGFRVNLSEI